jgi:hypothetical protein
MKYKKLYFGFAECRFVELSFHECRFADFQFPIVTYFVKKVQCHHDNIMHRFKDGFSIVEPFSAKNVGPAD